jgi:hypothetical protein
MSDQIPRSARIPSAARLLTACLEALQALLVPRPMVPVRQRTVRIAKRTLVPPSISSGDSTVCATRTLR